MFCLSKGLGAPIGSLLCGPGAVIVEARAWRHRLGGGMRQAGVIAAAGIVALETMVDRLADDHRRARDLAGRLASIEGVEPEPVETNIVLVDISRAGPGAEAFVAALAARGILTLARDERRIRLVTHRLVGEQEVEQVAAVVAEVAVAA
jgi:threonine aldolase